MKMGSLKFLLLFVFILTFSFSFVSAITCTEADYDKDGDVDFSDTFKFRNCYNQSANQTINGVDCNYWDFNKDGFVGDEDIASYSEVYQEECTTATATIIEETTAGVCSDTDGGKNYYNSGVVSSPENAYESDYCHNEILTEYFCSNETTQYEEFHCPYGCSDDRKTCATERAEVKEVTIYGRLIDQVTGESVSGAKLISAYEFSPKEVVTDNDGQFKVTLKDNFKLTEGAEAGRTSSGGQWSFMHECYDYSYFSMNKNYEGHKLDFSIHEFDEKSLSQDIADKGNEIEINGLKIYPSADISIESDIETSFNVMYKYKNSEGHNGGGQSGYTKEHYLSTALPLDYDVYIQFEDEAGNQYESSTYRVPLNARCGVVSLKYFNGESEWSALLAVEPTKETGPIVVEISERIKEERPEIVSRLCDGCLKDDKCYPFGYRKSGEYCSGETVWLYQEEGKETCDNNFECSSNVCVSSECVSEGLIKKILNWFANFF